MYDLSYLLSLIQVSFLSFMSEMKKMLKIDFNYSTLFQNLFEYKFVTLVTISGSRIYTIGKQYTVLGSMIGHHSELFFNSVYLYFFQKISVKWNQTWEEYP